MKKRLLACLLSAALLTSMFTGCAKEEPTKVNSDASKSENKPVVQTYKDYINFDSIMPIVKDGMGKDIKLKATVLHEFIKSDQNINEMWFWKFAKKYLNIDVEVTALDRNSLAEKKNMIFASNTIPDMMISMDFTPTELMTYGEVNKQLLDLKSYVTKELTPNLFASYEKYPETEVACTAPSGAMYTLPFNYYGSDDNLSTLEKLSSMRLFINQSWLDKLKLPNPNTLDEFLDTMRQFKEKDPAGVGSANVIPVGMVGSNPTILQLFAGANNVISDGPPLLPSLTTDDKVVIPATEDWYKDYVEYLKVMYDEGLISKDFYTISYVQLRALNAEGKLGTISDGAPYISVPETFKDWASVKPLVKKAGDTPVTKCGSGFLIGGFAVSAKTEYPEVCMKFADLFFNYEGYALAYSGPLKGHEYTMGMMTGAFLDENNVSRYQEVIDGKFTSPYEFGTTQVYPFSQRLGQALNQESYIFEKNNKEFPKFEWDLENADLHYRKIVSDATKDYLKAGYPSFVYLSESESQELTDIDSVLKTYIEAETAKFVTGARPIAEFDKFEDELVNMGADRLLEIYKKAYESSKK